MIHEIGQPHASSFQTRESRIPYKSHRNAKFNGPYMDIVANSIKSRKRHNTKHTRENWGEESVRAQQTAAPRNFFHFRQVQNVSNGRVPSVIGCGRHFRQKIFAVSARRTPLGLLFYLLANQIVQTKQAKTITEYLVVSAGETLSLNRTADLATENLKWTIPLIDRKKEIPYSQENFIK